MAKKYLYLFSEGNASMRELLGGKGANLAEMTNIGLPVPQGFTISTEACTQYYEDGRQINDEIQAQIMEYIAKMEEINGKKFGDLKNPLLVSVRSGARASMPGIDCAAPLLTETRRGFWESPSLAPIVVSSCLRLRRTSSFIPSGYSPLFFEK